MKQRDRAARYRCPRSTARLRCTARLLALSAFVFIALGPGLGHAQSDAGDPFETFNRGSFQFNLFLDKFVLRPVAETYRFVTPRFVRTGVSNALHNLGTPVTFANNLLQGESIRASESIGRFMFNTILGFGGLVDIGGMLGMPERHSEDFGQTMAVYGVGSGPYLMVPLLGPSNPRDLTGLVVDFVFDPFTYFAPTEASLARKGADVVSFREENIETIDELQRTSIDFYAATRTLAQQFREAEIRNGAPAPLDEIYDEDIYDESIFDEDIDDLDEPEDAGGS